MQSPVFIGGTALGDKVNFYLEFDVITRKVAIYASRHYEPRVPRIFSLEPRFESRVSSQLPASGDICFSIAETFGFVTHESATHKVWVMMSRILLN